MLCIETIGKFRCRRLVKNENSSEIARDLNLSRNTIKKYLKAKSERTYQRQTQTSQMLGNYQAQLLLWLEQDAVR